MPSSLLYAFGRLLLWRVTLLSSLLLLLPSLIIITKTCVTKEAFSHPSLFMTGWMIRE